MSVSNLFMAFSQLNFRIFVGCVLILSMFSIQTAFTQEDEFTWENGWRRHSNGGGWVHEDADVSDSVYVGPNGKIRGGTFKGSVKIFGGEIRGGTFEGSVKIFGGEIRGGKFSDNVLIEGGLILGGGFTENGRVSGGTIETARVGGNAEVTGGRIISGFVGGNAKIKGGLIEIYYREDGSSGVFGGTVEGGTLSDRVEMTGGTVKGGMLSESVEMTGGRIKDGIVTGNVKFSGGTIEGGYIDGHAEISGGRIKSGFVGENAKVSGGIIKDGRVGGNAHITGGTVKRGMHLRSGTFSRTTALRTFLRKGAKKLAISGIGIALALATVASEVVKGETGVFEAPARLADESGFSAETTSSDTVRYTIDDILEELKTSVQELDPTKAFSEERQMLHNRLRTLYTDVQVDTGLSDEEKEKHLKTIAEIQDIVQPPSPPRNPPRRRNRARSQPAQGLQGSLDSGDVKQEDTDNLRQEQPTRGIASTGTCLASDTKTISHQCLQQCACLLVQSNPVTPDANQKSVNQEVQP